MIVTAEGLIIPASDDLSVVGSNNTITGHATNVCVRGDQNNVFTRNAVVVGDYNTVAGNNSVVRGDSNTVTGVECEVTGDENTVSGARSAARGNRNMVTGVGSRAEGDGNTVRVDLNRPRTVVSTSTDGRGSVIRTSIGGVWGQSRGRGQSQSRGRGRGRGSGFRLGGANKAGRGFTRGITIGQMTVARGGIGTMSTTGSLTNVFSSGTVIPSMTVPRGTSTTFSFGRGGLVITSGGGASSASASASDDDCTDLFVPLTGKDEVVDNPDAACVVCKEHKPVVMFSPCNHLHTCMGCSKRLRESAAFKCPMCQAAIRRWTRVFSS